jgi:uncharacterized protein YgiM (DUF1202 family)
MGKEEFDSEQTGSRRIAKLMESISTSSINPRIAKLMESIGSPLNDLKIAKAMESIGSPLNDLKIAKAMGSIGSPLNDLRIAKAMESIGSPLNDLKIVKAMESIGSPLNDLKIAKAMGSIGSPLNDLRIAKAMESIGSPLNDLRIAEVMEPYRALLQDDTVGKFMEQYHIALEHTRFGKLFQNSYFETGSALAGASVENLLAELKNRRTAFTDGPSFGGERTPKNIEAEGSATVAVVVEGDARVEKAEPLQPSVKTQNLSSIPTWLIHLVLFLIFQSVDLLAQWEATRAAIVDLNARLPHSESPSKIRNFIRKELAGKPGDIRLVTGSDVNLRFEPSMNSEVILKLPKNDIVVVQGKEDRTWLFVAYELEGYWIEGYVSTKFLKKVRKY